VCVCVCVCVCVRVMSVRTSAFALFPFVNDKCMIEQMPVKVSRHIVLLKCADTLFC
jgi:hypothetical protein